MEILSHLVAILLSPGIQNTVSSSQSRYLPEHSCVYSYQVFGNDSSFRVPPLKSAFIPNLSSAHAWICLRCGVCLQVLFFVKLGHFLEQLAARPLEWSPPKEASSGQTGEQEHLQAVLPPNAPYHKTAAQVIILLSALLLISWISTRKTGHTRKIKELIREVWSCQYLPDSCQTYYCCRDVSRAIQRRTEGEAGSEISALLMWHSGLREAVPWGVSPRKVEVLLWQPSCFNLPTQSSCLYIPTDAFILLCKGLGGFLSN